MGLKQIFLNVFRQISEKLAPAERSRTWSANSVRMVEQQKFQSNAVRRTIVRALVAEAASRSQTTPFEVRHRRAMQLGFAPLLAHVPAAAVRIDAFFTDPWWHHSEVKKTLPKLTASEAAALETRPDGSKILSETCHRMTLLDGRDVAQIRRVLLSPRQRRIKEFSFQLAGGAVISVAEVAPFLPLFGMERIDPKMHPDVIVTEGAAATEALIGMGLAAVGTLTGALHTPSREALEPLRNFQTIFLWPDNDSIGVRHMERIAQRLHTLGAKNIRVIRWAGPRKGDAADFQEAEVGVRALMKEARVWKADSKVRNRGQLVLKSPRVPVSLELPLGVRAPRLSIEPFTRKPSALRRPPLDQTLTRAAAAAAATPADKEVGKGIECPNKDSLPEEMLRGLLNQAQGGGPSMRASRPIREVAFHDFAAYRMLLKPQLIHFYQQDPGLADDQPVNMDLWADFDWFVRLFPSDFRVALEVEVFFEEQEFVPDEHGYRRGDDFWWKQEQITAAVAECGDAFSQTMGPALFELYLTAKDRFLFVDRARVVVGNWFNAQLRQLTAANNALDFESFNLVQTASFWADGIPDVIGQIGQFERIEDPKPGERTPLFGEKLPPAYSFTPFQPGSINFGFQTIYRQTWTPLGTQPGEVVRTLPLGPRQSEKIEIKVVRTQKANRMSETARSIETSTESSSTEKDSSEVVADASSKFNWNVKADVSGPISAATGSIEAGMGGELASSSRDTKTFLNETMNKSASKLRSDSKLVITTEREGVSERSQHSEIVNPNDEIAVTYVYSRLQRQYEIQAYLAEVTAVIYVAEPIPAPKDITPDWIRRYDWVIADALLDESFRSDLEVLRSGERADNADDLIDPRIARLMESLSGEVPDDRPGIPADWAGVRGTIPDLFQNMQQAYEREVERERARHMQREAFLRSARRLRGHIYDNILHYCRAIWSSEDPQSRLLRFRQRRIPIRWDFISTDAPGSFTVEGQFVPAISNEARDTRMLAELADLSGPIGYCGNYSIYRLKFSEEWESLVDMINLARTPYKQIATSVQPADIADADKWFCFGVASPSRQEERRYRLAYTDGPEPEVAVEAEQAAGVYVEVERVAYRAGRPIQFQGVRVWIEPAAGAALANGQIFSVHVRILPVLEDPERRALKWSSGPLRRDQETDFFTAETILSFADLFADCMEVLRDIDTATLSWATLAETAKATLRGRYFDYLLRNLHSRRILVDSNDVILTREVDTMTSLEPFKAMHRYIDVLSAYEDVVAKRLENQRYSARLGKGRLGDPNIDRMTVFAGSANVNDLVALDDRDDEDPTGPSTPGSLSPTVP